MVVEGTTPKREDLMQDLSNEDELLSDLLSDLRVKEIGKIDLSDSNYFLVVPSSADFSLLDKVLSDDIGRIRAVIILNDGLYGDGFEEFTYKLSIVTSGRVKEISLGRPDQLTIIRVLSKAKSLMGDMRPLVVCHGIYAIPLFHAAMYISGRAIILTETGYQELLTFPTWKLKETALAILYILRELEKRGIKSTPYLLVDLIHVRAKGKKSSDSRRSKMVSLDYYIKNHLAKEGLVVKERDPDSKRGVVYKLTGKGSAVADLVEAHLLTVGSEISEYLSPGWKSILDRLSAGKS